MKTTFITDYLLNCMLLLLPIMIWNGIFSSKLPWAYATKIFDKDIPAFLSYGENIFRLFVFILPLFMPLKIETQNQKLGLFIYIAGTIIYFVSWLAQIYFSQSVWSLSAFGFLAPAYTPLIWLFGIGLIGKEFYFASPYRSWMYIVLAIVFTSFHLSHATVVYLRNIY